ncbi:hypothetical protein EB796_004044 [Bugula neritina]|uniref:Uncharacterized protein n=1 Tax=Bugula neritina TaxID=10212 RepID=A0A7J7KG51_BUGNE|nr:hypothetical protein EB796_004044 [Bugula neritina]
MNNTGLLNMELSKSLITLVIVLCVTLSYSTTGDAAGNSTVSPAGPLPPQLPTHLPMHPQLLHPQLLHPQLLHPQLPHPLLLLLLLLLRCHHPVSNPQTDSITVSWTTVAGVYYMVQYSNGTSAMYKDSLNTRTQTSPQTISLPHLELSTLSEFWHSVI